MTAANLTRRQDPKHGPHMQAVRVASEALTLAQLERDKAIKRAYSRKVPATDIAEAAGLTRVRIYQIIGRS